MLGSASSSKLRFKDKAKLLLFGYFLGFMVAYSFIGMDNTTWLSLKSTLKIPHHIYNNVVDFYRPVGKIRKIKNQTTSNTVRVLCWVQTHPANHKKRAIHIKKTWGRRCDKLLFMSVENDTALPTVKLEGFGPEMEWLWNRHNAAFKYVYDNHFNDADWFMKTDDDTYVVVENLKLMLQDKNSSDPLYFGCRLKGWVSGGSGYVLSKEALRRFIEKGIAGGYGRCPSKERNTHDDVLMAKCLKKLGVVLGDSRDEGGRHRFLPLPLERYFNSSKRGYYAWYWRHLWDPQKKEMDCCSDTIVAFHYVQPLEMYVMEYLIYHVNPVNASINRYESTAEKGRELSVGSNATSTNK